MHRDEKRPWVILLLLPVMVGCVFCAAQAGFLLARPTGLGRQISPYATADYSPWAFVQFQPVQPRLETLIAQEAEGTAVIVAMLSTATPVPASATSQPTATDRPTLIPTNTARPSLTPFPTQTTRPTQTVTPIPSATASATLRPTATSSITPLPTLTRTSTASITPLPTLTRTSTASVTPLPTLTRTSTVTPIPTQTRTATLIPSLTATALPTPFVPTSVPPTDTNIPPTPIPPTFTPSPTSLPGLILIPSCSPDANSVRVWKVQNSDGYAVNFTWALVSGTDSGSGTVPAASGGIPGEMTFISNTEPGLNTLQLFVDGNLLATMDSDPTNCPSAPCSAASIENGAPDGDYCTLVDGNSVVIDVVNNFGVSPLTADGNPGDAELIYYEHYNSGSIFFDWISIEISPDGVTWYTVFYWGNGVDDTNTNLVPTYAGSGEPDNFSIPAAPPLVGSPFQVGITMDIDALVPPGMYPYLRITSIGGGTGEPAEIDAIGILP